MSEQTITVQTDRGSVNVDASIAAIVQALNDAGVQTVASCSGHGHRPGNIALADGRELIIARDFAEARKIDALFPVGISGEAVTVPEWEVIKCHFCGGFGMKLPWRAGNKYACAPCGERERLGADKRPSPPQQPKGDRNLRKDEE